MSYRCAECNSVRYGKILSIVKDVREVDYVRSKIFFDRQEKRYRPIFEKKFNGWEINKQIHVCEECYEKLKDSEPTVVDRKVVNFFIKNRNNRNYTAESKPKDKQRTNRHNTATNKHRRDNRDRNNIYEDGR